MSCYFGDRERRRLDISTILLYASHGDVCFRLGEKIEASVGIFREVDDPEVGSYADDARDLNRK